MSGFLELFSQYDVLGAFLVNIELTLWSALFSLILGVILVVMRISPISSLRAVAGAYVELFKNLPLTIIMVFMVLGAYAQLKLSFSVTFITKARNNARLIVVTPEQGIPCHVVHSLLPVAEQCFQRHKVRFSQRPFFTTGIIDLQVMKIKGHRQFTACQCRVSLAMLKAGGGHFTYGH